MTQPSHPEHGEKPTIILSRSQLLAVKLKHLLSPELAEISVGITKAIQEHQVYFEDFYVQGLPLDPLKRLEITTQLELEEVPSEFQYLMVILANHLYEFVRILYEEKDGTYTGGVVFQRTDSTVLQTLEKRQTQTIIDIREAHSIHLLRKLLTLIYHLNHTS